MTQARTQKFSEGGGHHGGIFFYAARKLSTCTPLQGFFWLRGGLGPMAPPPFGTGLVHHTYTLYKHNEM
jgi:hypothetical protein